MKEYLKGLLHGPAVENPELKTEVYSMLLNMNIIIAAVFSFLNITLDKHAASYIVSLFSVVYYLILIIVNKKLSTPKAKRNLYIFLCVFQGCIHYPIMYITAGGIYSGLPFLYIFAGISTVLLLDNMTMISIFILNNLAFISTFVIEWFYPDVVHQYTSTNTFTFCDTATAVIMVGCGLGAILKILTAHYDTNQEKASELLTQIEESSTKDPLTGAYNRRYLMEYIDKCIAQTESGEIRTFSLLMFDLDHFKSINDTYGHLAGDDCIRSLAYILKNSLRKVDVVSRYGGEEFICVLPTAEDTPAFRRAEQIRTSVESTQLSDAIGKMITVSGGVAMYKPGMTSEELIHAVDANLYIAKESGRNQIVWHEGGIPPLCYVAYDSDVLRPVQNSGRRFTDLSKA